MKSGFFQLKLTAFAVFLAAKLFSQPVLIPGYLINAKGDTLKGEVKVNPKKVHDNFFRIFFKDEKGVQKNYKPDKVKGYGFENKHYVSITEQKEALFYLRLTQGAIILYKSSFVIEGLSETTKELAWYLHKEGDKKLTEVKETKFKKQIQDWMSGSAGFANDYEDGKTFNEAAAIEVINKYNEWKKSN